MKLSLGFSPCPNDTFIFDALIHGKIDTGDLEFDVHFDDVETLNRKALRAELDITKLSYYAFGHVLKHYALLNAGSALGFGVGPLLIAADPGWEGRDDQPQEPLMQRLRERIPELSVGIPGKYTTANFLLSLAFPDAGNKTELVFSEIEDALVNKTIDLGLIIHENRFTYRQKGLRKVLDLGEYWEQETGCPIPLGGIMIKRSIRPELQARVDRLIRQSVEYAFAHPESGREFIRSHAQAMDEEVMYRHIELYVNDYSLDLGDQGRKAIRVLFEKAAAKGLLPQAEENIFIEPV